MAKRRQSVSIQEEDAFKLVIDELMEEIVWHPTHEDVDVATWLLKMVDYNVPRKDTFAASFYIPEDIIRGSVTRRGQLCWHLVDEVGKAAVNDAFLLQSVMYFILDLHFKGKACHKYLTKLFHKCFFNTTLGQNMDSRIGKAQGFKEFTMENYYRISKYKVGYFSFYLPIASSWILQADGTPKEEELKLIEEIALEMGHLFQVQDDYLDCFGNPNVTGRYGTTIQGNCSSWFIIMALKKMDCEQERVLKEHYGKPGSERVHRVIKVFRDLDLVEEYRQYEIKCYKAIMKKITKLPESIPALYFSETLDLILKREK
ncbi:Farnesyl pyrophosphate synthase [Folsomia candida]|uniref:Farnesyl pyrophosphate synthase n=1 Tax=Folsomia candida TaxID=158441 RepID=A0A226F2A7_FOLCA|nr:Farnesyl pyrophosphate synthase [Folsomia candida]